MAENTKMFGSFLKAKVTKPNAEIQKIASPISPVEDGAQVIDQSGQWGGGGVYSHSVDLNGSLAEDAAKVIQYREVSIQPEANTAIEDIVNEMIIYDDEGSNVVSIDLQHLDQSENIKTRITDEYEYILNMLRFNQEGYDIARDWYVDGRIYYQKVIDPNDTSLGIIELKRIESTDIKKVKEIRRKPVTNGAESYEQIESIHTYYLYSDSKLQQNASRDNGVKIAPEAITFVHCGIFDARNTSVLSHLHKSVKPINMLRMVEDALVIYRIARAPERRIFYIDVGGLNKTRSEQYVKNIMSKFKNKLTYNPTTGTSSESSNQYSMLEDFWLPRQNGKGTEVTTLPGGQNLGEIDDITYFQRKVYQSINVPIGRLDPDQGFNLGKSSEISREEIRFSKFIDRLRTRFNMLFLDILKTQLILKGVIRKEEWDMISQNISFNYQRDNYFAELKEGEILTERLTLLGTIDTYTGKYYSRDWIQREILKFDEEEIADMKKQIEKEEIEYPEPEEEEVNAK